MSDDSLENTLHALFLVLSHPYPLETGVYRLRARGQEVSLDGAVIVTTPQRLSFVDVVKGIDMFDELKVLSVRVFARACSRFTCLRVHVCVCACA